MLSDLSLCEEKRLGWVGEWGGGGQKLICQFFYIGKCLLGSPHILVTCNLYFLVLIFASCCGMHAAWWLMHRLVTGTDDQFIPPAASRLFFFLPSKAPFHSNHSECSCPCSVLYYYMVSDTQDREWSWYRSVKLPNSNCCAFLSSFSVALFTWLFSSWEFVVALTEESQSWQWLKYP